VVGNVLGLVASIANSDQLRLLRGQTLRPEVLRIAFGRKANDAV
jgi:hypothetical protein